jgi:hypothetical protein
MLKEWRRRIIAKRGGQNVPLGRSILSFSKRADLFADIKTKSSQNLIRIAVKKGILLVATQEHYIPGTIPTICEMAPLLLVNDPNVDLERFDPNPVLVDIPEETLEKWSKSFPSLSRLHKRIFVSYWMSDPTKGDEESSLVEVVTKKFGTSVEITTGRLIGSPRWSPAIIANISKVDLVLCDLTTPRRDVFVEYGVAIGQHIPLIQCFVNPAKESVFPLWVKNRQNQYFAATATLNRKFETSVAAFLENKPDAKGSWRRDSAGRTLDALRDPRNLLMIGPQNSRELADRLLSSAREFEFNMQFLQASSEVDNLEQVIKAVRAAGTLILAFEDTPNDYLTCVAGGIFAIKQRAKTANSKIYDLDCFLLSLSETNATPGLLNSHPQAVNCDTIPELQAKFKLRLHYLQEVIRKGIEAKK